MATLEQAFERKAEAAFLEDAEDKDPGRVLAEFAIQNFQDYASEHGYDIDFIWDEVEVTTTRSGDTIQTEIDFPDLTALFEYGVSPHTIQGNPLLHFYWEAADRWVRTEEVNWGSETGGIPEARAIRTAIDQLRGQVQARGPGGRFR